MLMSVSTSEQLTVRERLFDSSPVTPAVRANDTTDIHLLDRRPVRDAAVATVPHRDGRADPGTRRASTWRCIR